MENRIRLAISYIRTRQIVVSGKINGKRLLFIIDTGASESVFHTGTAEELGLTPEKLNQQGAGVGSASISVFKLPQVTLELGKASFILERPIAMDLSHVLHSLKAFRARRSSVILGADLLKRYKAVIDYDKMEISLTLPSEN